MILFTLCAILIYQMKMANHSIVILTNYKYNFSCQYVCLCIIALGRRHPDRLGIFRMFLLLDMRQFFLFFHVVYFQFQHNLVQLSQLDCKNFLPLITLNDSLDL